MNRNDVVLCGLPRSGSTLTCELLNKAPDVVALDEPLDQQPWAPARPARRMFRRPATGFDPGHFIRSIDAFFEDTRVSLLRGGGATSKQVEGRVLGSKFVDERSSSGLREQLTEIGTLEVDKALSRDFVLAVKHNAGFAATLEHLVPRYRCFAIIRNPLAMLASWQTVSVPIQQGRVPRAEQVDPHLTGALDSTPDQLDRQLILLDWFFARFAAHLERDATIRYEDIVASRGRVLAVIAPGSAHLDESLSSRNRSSVYHPGTMRTLAERLLAAEGAWWSYYSPDDVRALIEGDEA